VNQILQTEIKKNNGPVEIGKVIKFFVVAIIIFALVLIGLGGYYLISNKNENTNQIENPQMSTKPSINITKQENNTILLEVTHSVAISKILYNWNGEEDSTIEGETSTSLSKEIDLPFGTNTLNLTVIDINGEETRYQKEYVVDGNGKPVIELKLTKDYKIKIIVQDSIGLQYINYSWNNDEPTKVEVNAETPNKIEKTVEIPIGQNTLKVEAVSQSEVVTAKELDVKRVKGPDLSFKKQGDSIIIKAEDEVGLKVIDYTLNGQKYQINYGNKTVIEYKQQIEKGENHMEIRAENQDGGVTTKKVKILN